MPIPRALMMTADGHTAAHSDGTGWSVVVNAKAPIVGSLVSYTGDVYNAKHE